MLETDEALVRRCREAPPGDTRAFDELVRRHQGTVLANCRYLTGSPDDAEDLAQGVFVKAYFGLRRFQGRAAFRTWIQRIKVNHCLNHLRSRRNRRTVDVEDPSLQGEPELRAAPEAEQAVVDADRRKRIQEVLNGLPDSLRIPLVMRDLDGMAYQDIAEALGLGLSAVKMRVRQAREAFRKAHGPRAGAAP